MSQQPNQRIKLAEDGSCFVCGTETHEHGAGVLLDGEYVLADFTFDKRHQGPPGHADGGSLAAVLDEAMGAAVWLAGHSVVAAHLSWITASRYRKGSRSPSKPAPAREAIVDQSLSLSFI